MKTQARPTASLSAVLRAAIVLGFRVIVSDSAAGAIQVERVDVDRQSTAYAEWQRLQILDSMTRDQQTLARRIGDSALTTPITVRRRLTVSVLATNGEVMVAPAVDVCLNEGSIEKCASRSTLQASEAAIVALMLETAAAPHAVSAGEIELPQGQ